MVDDFHSNAPGFWFWESAGGIAVECRPCFWIDFGLKRSLERAVRVVCTQEIGVTNEKALLVVVSVDKPACDAIRAVAPYLACVGVKHIDAVDFDPQLAVL